MENYSLQVICFISIFFFISYHSVALDTLYANQAIKDGKTLVSRDGVYELGFFSPGKSKNRYVGIWYKKISLFTVVWVANRETPILDKSGMFKVSQDGNLVIFNGENTIIWSSNSTIFMRNNSPMGVVVQLLDTGNLVVKDQNNTNPNIIWESFDYPSDTLLPGMKFGIDMVTGLERYISSWKSPHDPSIGSYVFRVDTNGYPQHIRWKGESLVSRIGPWNGLGYNGYPSDIPNPLYEVEFVFNKKEIYSKFELRSSVLQRIVLKWDGKIQIFHWIERTQEWIVYGDATVDRCNQYAVCGPYGNCRIDKHPPCSCMEGFEPKIPKEWGASDWSSGCRRKTPLNCVNGDGFKKISRIKLPDTRRSWYNHSMTLVECEMACRMNCSCTAYANIDIRNEGSGCLLWFGELIDIREYDQDHNIFIRMAASELADRRSYSKKGKGILSVALSVSLAAMLLSAVAYAFKNRKKRRHMKEQENLERAQQKKNTSAQIENLVDIPFFSLYEVAKATENFNIQNKIGEGGFGPVYKGVLDDGQEVAVKRLSETSQQGLDEFKNELIFIAKLQHRNLVKLLGYFIHGNEMILIYEYMSNKSLDSFIFGETRSSILDWSQRFKIIQGIARGMLYLHQDSRFQIIHRDIKAGNILLDGGMNPKISDFGLARKFVGHDTIAKTKKVVGTYGYLSPEYAIHGRFSVKSDVFSFGVLMLEIVSGKKNREFYQEDCSNNLLGHAWRLYKEDKTMELISASLRSSCIVHEVLRTINVALLCVQHHPKDRPTMLSALLMLVGDIALPKPKKPAFFSDESYQELDHADALDEYMITLLYPR